MATAADPTVRPASEKKSGLSGEVTVRSKAAGLPQSQLEARMSAGHVCRRPRGSKGCSGQGGEPGEVSSPSHHLMAAIWCSLVSRPRPGDGDGTTESLTIRDKPCQQYSSGREELN